MKAQREVSHLLRIAYESQINALGLSVQGGATREVLATVNGYIQGLQRAAGEIATLAGDSIAEVELLDEEIRQSVFKPVQG